MVCFIELLNLLPVKIRSRVDHTPRLPYSPIWHPGPKNISMSRRPVTCVKVSSLKDLEKKNWSVLFSLFSDVTCVALRVDDIPLSQGLPSKYTRFTFQFNHITRKAQRDLTYLIPVSTILCHMQNNSGDGVGSGVSRVLASLFVCLPIPPTQLERIEHSRLDANFEIPLGEVYFRDKCHVVGESVSAICSAPLLAPPIGRSRL